MIQSAKGTDIDSYIAGFPTQVQEKLIQLRLTIKNNAPGATETIKYGIPTFVYKGKNLVHFGGFKAHVSLFPTAAGTEHFKDQLNAYKCTKGTIQFPLDKPLPLSLITRIVKFRVKQVTGRTEKKKSAAKAKL
ncbi:MAG: iron chaperone [Candidatus Dadabacteria bacterium]